MKDNDVRSIIATERQRFVHYVRSLIRETAEMDAEDVVHDVIISILERADLVRPDFLLAYIFRSLRRSTNGFSSPTPESAFLQRAHAERFRSFPARRMATGRKARPEIDLLARSYRQVKEGV